MKRTKFLHCPPCTAPRTTDSKVITAVSQILEVEGEQAVEISLFSEDRLKARYFADKENHSTWVNEAWTSCKFGNVLRICKGQPLLKNDYFNWEPRMEWASEEDERRVYDFLDTYSIDNYETVVSSTKRENAQIRKQRRINEMMAEVPCVPEKAKAWVENKFFPGDILFFKKEKNRTAFSCTACGYAGWKKNGWKHGEKTTCPKCKAPVTANSRQQEKTREVSVTILQQYGRKWAERQFRAVCRWMKGKKEIQLFERIRAIIPLGKTWGTVWYGTVPDADEFHQEFWDAPHGSRFVPSYLYPGNLPEVLKAGGLEHSGMDILANAGEKFNVNAYIITFYRRPYLEYLAKAGLTRLTADIAGGCYGSQINTNGKNLKQTLQLDGNHVTRLKAINGGINALEWLQYEQDCDIRITQESLEWLAKKKLHIDDCESILNELGSVNRMVNYIKKQKVAASKFVITWRDYLHMARQEGYDTSDDIVRFPRDLKARHDHLVELGNQRENDKRLKGYKKLDEQIKQRLPEMKRYFWEDTEYMIIPAGTCKELMDEGRSLHHCVGRNDTYMKKMADGISWILFLRKKENLDRPYYTIEISLKDDHIIQFYSEYDRQPDKGIITDVLNRYKSSIRKKKIKIQVPAAGIA